MRRAPPLFALLAALTQVACGDAAPRILDVSVLQDSADARGAYRLSAVVLPGDGATAVVARFTTGTPEDLDAVCGAPPGHGAWRNVDAGPPEDASSCFVVPLAASGDRFEGTLTGPPFLLGTHLWYRIEATDTDGDVDRWPASGPSPWIVGPAGRAPILVALAPTRGPATGGTEVLVRGAGFSPDVEVLFGGIAAPEVSLESEHLLVVRTPAGPPGAADLVVRRAGLDATLAGAFEFVAPPVVARVSPAEGPTEAETLVVIEGDRFEPGATVAFADAAPAEATWLSAVRLGAVAPPHAAGTGDLIVTNPDGQQGIAPDAFTWWPRPVLLTIEPERGPDLGGTRVRVTGADLREPGVLYLGFRRALELTVEPGGRAATFMTPLAPEGRADVRFFNPDGQFGELALGFRFVGPPSVDAAEPGEVSRCGGGVVELVGRNFDAAMQVLVGDLPAAVLDVSDDGTRARIRVPAGAPGPVRVTITNPDGRVARADDLIVYGVRPTLTPIEPVRVPVWGGVAVEVAGADLDPAVEVRVDGVAPEQVNFIGGEACDQRLRIVVPTHVAGPAGLSATNPDGVGASLDLAFVYVAPEISPNHGLLPGYANVELRGVDLRRGLRVRLAGAAPRTIERVSDELWRLVTPPGVHGAATVEVRNSDGRGVELAGAFSYRALFDRTADRLEAIGDCNDLSVADLDGDGDADVVTANGAVGGLGQVDQPIGVHLNDGTGHFALTRLRPQGNGMNARLGDYDADGDLDLLVANLSSVRNQLFQNDGRGGFRVVNDFPAVGPSYDADFVDVDLDGDLDVFTLQTGSPDGGNRSGPEQLWLNDGRGGWQDVSDRVAFDVGDVHDHDFAAGDLNGDGLPDVVIVVDNLSASFQTARNRLLLNRGGGRFEFAESPFDDFQGDWLHVEMVDVDADGDLDVVLPQDYLEGFSRAGTPAVALFLNDGRGTFTPAHDRLHGMPRVPAFESVTTDVDGDGDPDMLIAVFGILYSDGSIDPFRSVLLLNDGTASFFEATAAFADAATVASTDFGVADFDGDGDFDLIECAARGESRYWSQE